MSQNNNNIDNEKKTEDWMNAKWRPAMGWMYMFVCLFDFVCAPVLWSLVQALFHGGVNVQWQPLTLQGAGLFHISMGAVLGLAAYGRTQEKLAGANNGGLGTSGPDLSQGFGPGMGTTYVPPNATTMNNINQGSAFGGTPLGSNTMSTTPAFGVQAPTINTAGATCPNTGKPLGPSQSFPAL